MGWRVVSIDWLVRVKGWLVQAMAWRTGAMVKITAGLFDQTCIAMRYKIIAFKKIKKKLQS
jgi:hypothetical protein